MPSTLFRLQNSYTSYHTQELNEESFWSFMQALSAWIQQFYVAEQVPADKQAVCAILSFTVDLKAAQAFQVGSGRYGG